MGELRQQPPLPKLTFSLPTGYVNMRQLDFLKIVNGYSKAAKIQVMAVFTFLVLTTVSVET